MSKSRKPLNLDSFKIEMVPIDQLRPYPQNPKAHPEAQVEKIAKSIKEFGFLVPLVIDGQGEVVAGHGRLLAAQKINLGIIPCIRAEHLNPAQIRAFRIADNWVLESEWLFEALAFELQALDEMDFDLGVTGFSAAEIKEMSDLLADVTLKDVSPPEKRNLGNRKYQVKPVLYVEQIDIFERAIKETGEQNRGAALIKICEAYLDRPER